MSWLVEDPTPLIVAAILALVVLFVFLLKTGRGVILLAMAGVILLAILGIVIERLIVTPLEEVETVIYQAAAAAERNELEKVVEYLSPTTAGLRAEARRWIGRMKVDSVKIFDLEIEVNQSAQPRTATARFLVVAQGDIREAQMIHDTYVGRLTVDFEFQDGRWFVTRYERDR